MVENKTTFANFWQICKDANVEIIDLSFEGELRGKVKVNVRIKGSFLEISEKLDKLVKELKPFIDDKYLGKWLNVSGSMDLHNFTGMLIVEVGFRGIGIELE